MGKMQVTGARIGYDYRNAWFFRLGDLVGVNGKGLALAGYVLAMWLLFSEQLFMWAALTEHHEWWVWPFIVLFGMGCSVFLWFWIVLVAFLLDLILYELADHQQCLHWVVNEQYPQGCVMAMDYDGKSAYPTPPDWNGQTFLLMRWRRFRKSAIISSKGVISTDIPVRYSYEDFEHRLIIGPIACSIIGGRLDEMIRLIAHNGVGTDYGARLVQGRLLEKENDDLKFCVHRLQTGTVFAELTSDVSAVIQNIAQDKAKRPSQALARVRQQLEGAFRRNNLTIGTSHPDLMRSIKELEALGEKTKPSNV